MTNYYAYRNWVVKIDAPLFGTTRACIFNLESGDHYAFPVQAGDTHAYICEKIDICFGDSTDYTKGFGGLMYLSGRDAQMVREIFERYC